MDTNLVILAIAALIIFYFIIRKGKTQSEEFDLDGYGYKGE